MLSVQKRPEIVPVILAGGAGNRLRPLTGPRRAKPFLRVFSEYSLFQETALRAGSFAPPVVVCSERFGRQVAAELDEIDVKPEVVILEPEVRGTAAAVAASAFYLKERKRDCLMLVMPSDHYLPDAQAFERAVLRGAASAASGMLMMIGVKPRSADPRFGYIVSRGAGYMSGVEKFIEKPDLKTVRQLVKGGRCCWNTGMFMTKPGFFLIELARKKPEVYQPVDVSCQAGTVKEPFFQLNESSFVKTMTISVDYAVLEGCVKTGVVILDSPWDDLGTWPSFLRFKKNLWLAKNKAYEGGFAII